jgi:hypothetical protein
MYACGHSFPMLLVMWWIHIQALVAALRILGLRGQFLDLSHVYSEPGSVKGSTETHLRERTESVHCIAMLLPNTK